MSKDLTDFTSIAKFIEYFAELSEEMCICDSIMSIHKQLQSLQHGEKLYWDNDAKDLVKLPKQVK